jgi:hypothetical protein
MALVSSWAFADHSETSWNARSSRYFREISGHSPEMVNAGIIKGFDPFR